MKKRDDQSLQESRNVLCDIENKLALSGYILSQEGKIFALSPEYDFITTLLETGELQDLEEIFAMLLIREDQLKREETGGTE